MDMSRVSAELIAMYSDALERERALGPKRSPEFWNYGYWLPSVRNSQEASLALLQHLLAKLPPQPRSVLDVAFGKGESTLRLCQMFGPECVTGINIAADQVDYARERGIPCALRVMDAARLGFEAETFDCILCIEAAFHFQSRLDFLLEAHRVLRPAGRLLMSDILFRSTFGLDPAIYPGVNHVDGLEPYRELFMRAGFSADRLVIERSTQKQVVAFCARKAQELGILLQHPMAAPADLSPDRLWWIRFLVTRLLNISECVIVCAEK
jgi:MPBQ/MSBQ methyltransferase